MSMQHRRSTTRNTVTFIVLLILFFTQCDTADDPTQSGDQIVLAEGTTSVVLEVTSRADRTTIPIYLALPTNQNDQLKTVVVLHGSGGPWDDDDTNGDGIADVCHVGELSTQNKEWEALLTANGFAAVFPDSYSPRGTCENEGNYKMPPLKFKISGTFIRNRDAYDVLALLEKLTWKKSKQPVIDMTNVALVGFSDGGTSAISTLYDTSATPVGWTWKQSFNGQAYTQEILPPAISNLRFKTGVIYYPGAYHNGYYGNICTDKGIYRSSVDVLFHLAEDDDLTENSDCLIATMLRLGGGVPTVHRYLNTNHGFDGNEEPESTIARERSITFIKSKFAQ